MNVTEIIIVIVGVLFMIGMAYRTERRVKPVRRNNAEMEREMEDLKATVNTLRRQLDESDRRIKSLEAANRELTNSLEAAQRDLENTKKEITSMREQLTRSRLESTRRDLLVGVGPDSQLEIDLAVLRKVRTQTGLGFSRLLPVTFANLRNALSRARTAGRPIQYLHLAVHAGPSGVQFTDGIISGGRLSEILPDVEILLLAGCEAADVGDLLGVVPTVITMREVVTMRDAADFTYVFWREVGNGASGEDAFYAACEAVPTVEEFAELHI